MTDKQKLANLFAELGIGFKEKEQSIRCDKGMTKVECVTGYNGIFVFTEDGSLSFFDVGQK